MRPNVIRLGTLLAATGAAVLLSACSSAGNTSATPATSASSASASAAGSSSPSAKSSSSTIASTITAKDFKFGPPLTVAAGATVTFANADDAPHNVTDDDGAFTSKTVTAASTTFTAPSKAGTYHFHCSVHPEMHGTLVVQ